VTEYTKTMQGLPDQLIEMAALVRAELQLPEAEQVSLVRLSTMLKYFTEDAKRRGYRRKRAAEAYR
jgi:hypothetical protein